MTEHCNGEHRFFACDLVGVEAEGKVFVILACTACGEVRTTELTVSAPGAQIERSPRKR